jgi:hypothetical protein
MLSVEVLAAELVVEVELKLGVVSAAVASMGFAA